MVTVEVGKTVTVAPVVTVSVAVSYLDVSVLLIALMVTVKDVLLLAGAVNVPMVLFPPKVSFTYHFTPAVSELGVTEYANCCVLSSLTADVFGLTVTVMV